MVVLSAAQKFAQSMLRRWVSPRHVILEADSNRNGMIEFDELSDLCLKTLCLDLSQEEIRQVFNELDQEKRGLVGVADMEKFFKDAQNVSNEQLFLSVRERAKSLRRAGSTRELIEKSKPMEGMVDTKLVALVAHNDMKPSMMQFVAENSSFFRAINIVTTGSTGAALEKKLGLHIAHKVSSGPLGGDQEIGSLVAQHKVAIAFFFIDPLTAHPHDADIRALIRICDVHNIATATNPSTGTALVEAFTSSEKHIKLLFKSSLILEDSEIVKKYKQRQQQVIGQVARRANVLRRLSQLESRSTIESEAKESTIDSEANNSVCAIRL